jgi:hypothetical protein
VFAFCKILFGISKFIRALPVTGGVLYFSAFIAQKINGHCPIAATLAVNRLDSD